MNKYLFRFRFFGNVQESMRICVNVFSIRKVWKGLEVAERRYNDETMKITTRNRNDDKRIKVAVSILGSEESRKPRNSFRNEVIRFERTAEGVYKYDGRKKKQDLVCVRKRLQSKK